MLLRYLKKIFYNSVAELRVNTAVSPQYYLPEEITPQMFGHKIRIVGGPLDGYEGYLQTVRGSKVKRLLVELDNYLAVSVEVLPEFIQLI